MKKKLLCVAFALVGVAICGNYSAKATIKPHAETESVSHNKQFVIQYTGHVQDPANPAVNYQLYGSAGHITSIKVVNQSGIPTGATATGTGVYTNSGAVYSSSGTITRSNGTSFSFNITEDIS